MNEEHGSKGGWARAASGRVSWAWAAAPVVAAMVISALVWGPTWVSHLVESSPRSIAAAPRTDATLPAAVRAPAAPRRAQAPVQFEPNVGQASAAVRYLMRAHGLHAAVYDDGLALTRDNPRGEAAPPVKLSFVGARRSAPIEPREASAARAHYLHGSDPAAWLRDVPMYGQLRQSAVYPGVDLVYYSREGELEYDLVVQPGADPSRIRMRVNGAHKPQLAASGDLLLDGPDGALRLHRPVLYQNVEGERRQLDGRYVMLAANEVGFDLPAYDRTRPLIIDPTFKLLYSTYLTGFHDEQVGGMTVDAQGNAYVVGQSNSEDFVVSGNAFQRAKSTVGLQHNVVVTKFDASGTLLYSTYLGGTGSDIGAAIAVDAAGNAYITGETTSRDFPVTAGAYQPTFKGSPSAYLSILSPDGSALSYSTYYGGTGSVQANSIALDPSGAAVISGTAGAGLTTTAGAYKSTLTAGSAAFVARFSPRASGAPQLVAASYYGVDNPQANSAAQGNNAYSMTLDASGAPWFTGQAFTTNLPVTAGAVQAAPTAMSASCAAGPAPLNSFAFVAKLSADLGSLVYATYLSGKTEPAGGTSCSEFGRAIALDAGGNVYITGGTGSASFPTTAGALQAASPAGTGFASYTGFVTKLKPDGSAILWSTYLGGNVGNTFPGALALDPAANAVWTTSVTGGGTNYPITIDALQQVHGGGGADAGVTQFDASTGALKYSTFLGGSSADVGLAIAVDSGGNAFVAGNTFSPNFPLTANAYERAFRPDFYGGADWFFSVLGNGTIGSLSRSTAGNAGDATIVVNATGIVAGAVATLVLGDGTSVGARALATADAAGRWPFTFLLEGAAPGRYDLLVRNPDGTELRKPAAVTVAAGEGPKLSMAIVGRPTVRIGTPSTYQLTLTNSGDSDAYYALVRIGLPPGVQAKYHFGPSVPAFPGDTTDYGAIPGTVTQNGVDYTMVVFPILPAGMTGSLSVELNAPDAADIELEAVLLPSYLPSFNAVRRAVGLGAERALALASGREHPLITAQEASKCASSVILLVAGGVALAAGLSVGGVVGASMAVLLGVVASSLANGPSAQSVQGQGVAAAQNAVQSYLSNTLQNIIGIVNVVDDCDHDHSIRNRLLYKIKPKASVDPNDKSGPAGDGSAAHYVKSAAVLPYQIAFENKASAGLAAAQVVVTDQLDPLKYDLSTLSLGSISWGAYRINVLPGLNNFATVYPIDATMSVRVQGSLNPATGVLKWTFTTIDPVTKLPPSDPTLGFLPANVNGTQGQGYVNFTVSPKAAPADGTKWENFASIVFDANAPIITPTWVNTLDTTPPVSRVVSATQKSGSNDVDVSWSATDAGSGATSYTVYVSDNGAVFAAWQTGVSTTSAVFSGTTGHSYGFFVVATDGAGNSEAPKTTAEANATVGAASAGGSGGGGCTIGAPDHRDASLVLLVLAALVLLWRRRLSSRFAASSQRRAPD